MIAEVLTEQDIEALERNDQALAKAGELPSRAECVPNEWEID
jgi:hypothetical protein